VFRISILGGLELSFWGESPPKPGTALHDTETVNLALVQCVVLANKLSLQELNWLIRIKLLTTGFLENLGSYSQFSEWKCRFCDPCRRLWPSAK